MNGKVSRWGNSLGVRIPKHLAQDLQLQEGDEIEISQEDNKLILKNSIKGWKFKVILLSFYANFRRGSS